MTCRKVRAVRRRWLAAAAGHRRRTAISVKAAGGTGSGPARLRTGPAWADPGETKPRACSQGSHPLGRPLARPAVGSSAVRRRAPARPGPVCLRRLLAAVLRILGVRSTPSSPSFVGACGAGSSLRRSCVADFLREFPAPCPAGRQGSVGRRASELASNQKTTGGEGKLAGHLSRPTHRNPLQKEQHHD